MSSSSKNNNNNNSSSSSTIRRSSRKRTLPTHSTYLGPLPSIEEKHLQLALKLSKEEHQHSSNKKSKILIQSTTPPIYYPTLQEWHEGPMLFLNKKLPEILKFGVCKIIPPVSASLHGQVAFKNMDHMKIPTKKQHINNLTQGIPFKLGKTYTSLKQFRDVAQQMKETWQEKLLQSGRDPNKEEDWEDIYWSLQDGSYAEECIVEYGNDISTDEIGSGFPIHTSTSPIVGENNNKSGTTKNYWYLPHFPYSPGCVLRKLKSRINGINVPWLYFGMPFTTFTWHIEDNALSSVNFHHFGATKTWYVVPPSAQKDFDTIFKTSIIARIEKEPELLHHLVTTMNPTVLSSHHIPVYRVQQKQGEYVITLPGAYHSGFSHGFNIGEAVNFAMVDWLEQGRLCRNVYRSIGRSPVIAYDKILWSLGLDGGKELIQIFGGITCLLTLYNELLVSLKEELGLRENCYVLYPDMKTCKMPKEDPFDDEFDHVRRCNFCQQPCTLSGIVCGECKTNIYCVRHIGKGCLCPSNQKVLVFWKSIEELFEIVKEVEKKLDTA
jgi:hypothetical protein